MQDEFELTRRLWMLGVGETALGLGLAGAIRGEPAEVVSLPPGLYQPMANHLGHALQSDARFHPIPAGSPTDYVQPRAAPFKPLFFSQAEFSLVRRLTALMLGLAENDNIIQEVAEWIDLRAFSSAATRQAAIGLDPSHRAVFAAYHGREALQDLEALNDEKIWRDGLASLDRQSRSQHNANFLDLDEKDQIEIMTSFSDRAISRSSTDNSSGSRFFALLKAEVIRGFYTSSMGLKELNYKGNAFYARSPGCNSR